jgi:hypothetical protein
MDFRIIGKITDIEIIATGHSIRDLTRLRKIYGRGRWRKMKGLALHKKSAWRLLQVTNREIVNTYMTFCAKPKGLATVRLEDDTIHTAEVHWYEAHGIGRKEFKVKFPLID